MTFKDTTSRKLFDHFLGILDSQNPDEEQKSKVYLLLEERLGLTKTSIAASQPVTLKMDVWQQLNEDINRLKEGYPIQHVMGKAWFYGLQFKVNRHVLIPRPETEELVDLIIKENRQGGLRILDIGTGSGCIPVCLKLEMSSAEVFSMDISERALEVARENANALGAEINFIQDDILKDDITLPKADIIVSNPPYVPESEKLQMQKEVLNHDPHIALFVKDDNPLIFYNKIAEAGIFTLPVGGKIYLEIHEKFGDDIMRMLQNLGYQNVRVIKDIHDKDRIITAIK